MSPVPAFCARLRVEEDRERASLFCRSAEAVNIAGCTQQECAWVGIKASQQEASAQSVFCCRTSPPRAVIYKWGVRMPVLHAMFAAPP